MNWTYTIGVAWYPDYYTESEKDLPKLIDQDLKRMKKCGISHVRIGEFSWSRVQPSSSTFTPEIFDLAFEIAQKNNIGVMLCTPTACPPKWLIDLDPSMLPVMKTGNPCHWGSRRHYDPCNETWQLAAKKITQYFAKRWGTHPNLIGWQVDNEFGHHDSALLLTDNSRTSFQLFLKEKFQNNINRLNQEWFNGFWSQSLENFSQVELPQPTFADHNPHMLLDFKRFCTKIYRSTQKSQIDIIRESDNNIPITHNLISDFYDLCPWKMTKDLDFVGFDHYQISDFPNPMRSASHFTLMSSLKPDSAFRVLEQQPVQVNWQKINRRLPLDWLFLWGLQSAFYGADGMYAFSWRRFPGGAEQYHDALIPHDERVPRSRQEAIMESIKTCLQKISIDWSKPDLPKRVVDTWIVHDLESHWSHEACSQSEDWHQQKILDHCIEACFALGWSPQFVEHVNGEIPLHISTLFLPGHAFEPSAEERESVKSFLARGGTVISLPRTGMKNRQNHMISRPVSWFSEDDFYLEDFGALGPEEVEVMNSHSAHTLTGRLWAEKIVPGKEWDTVACYKGGLWNDNPAILTKKWQKGLWVHFSSLPDINSNWREFMNSLPLAKSKWQYIPEIGSQVQTYSLNQSGNLLSFSINFSNIAVPTPKRIWAAYQVNQEGNLTEAVHRDYLPARSVVMELTSPKHR